MGEDKAKSSEMREESDRRLIGNQAPGSVLTGRELLMTIRAAQKYNCIVLDKSRRPTGLWIGALKLRIAVDARPLCVCRTY